MFIWNKNKHFDKISEEFYNLSMAGVAKITATLYANKAEKYIGEDADKFVMVTFLYFVFLQECSLRMKYRKEYQEEVALVRNKLIFSISDRLNYNAIKIMDIYASIKGILSDMANDERCVAAGLHYAYACHYLISVSSNRYNSEEIGFCDLRVSFLISKTFLQAANDSCKYLGLKFEIK